MHVSSHLKSNNIIETWLWLFQQGKKRADIAELVGVHYGVACHWIRAWEHGGKEAIKQGQRGRRAEEQRRLRAAQESVLRKLICNKNPDQMKLPFALWNRKAIQTVVKQMCSIRIAIRTIADYLKRWGYTPYKPAKRAYERKPKVVKEWLDNTYPETKSQACKEGAQIGIVNLIYLQACHSI